MLLAPNKSYNKVSTKNLPRLLISVPEGVYGFEIHCGKVNNAVPIATSIPPPATHLARFPLPPSHATRTTTFIGYIKNSDRSANSSKISYKI